MSVTSGFYRRWYSAKSYTYLVHLYFKLTNAVEKYLLHHELTSRQGLNKKAEDWSCNSILLANSETACLSPSELDL